MPSGVDMWEQNRKTFSKQNKQSIRQALTHVREFFHVQPGECSLR